MSIKIDFNLTESLLVPMPQTFSVIILYFILQYLSVHRVILI